MMKTFRLLYFLRNEQPNEEVWTALDRELYRWARVNGFSVEILTDFIRQVSALTPDQVESLRSALGRVDGAQLHIDLQGVLDDGDFASADYVGIFGFDMPDGFVRNESVALSSRGPCPACGLRDAFDVIQTAPFEIDERQAVDVGETHGVAMDLVNLPGGGLAVSTRVVDAWRTQGFGGWRADKLIDSRTRDVSTTMVQVYATTVVLTPCSEHTDVVGEPYCSGCGRAFGAVDGYFWIRDDEVDRTDLVSRHPSGRAMLYVSSRVRDSLLALDVAGLVQADVMRLCLHGYSPSDTPTLAP